MRYAIVINLDYDTNPHDECRRVWSTLRQRMMDSGFRLEGRLFTIELPEREACEAARNVMDQMDRDPVVGGKGMYGFLKEFYGYNHTGAANLIVPPTHHIKLEER